MPANASPTKARDRLAAAALRLFNSKGYAATTVREIVEEAGVTKPVLYYHFRSKEALYLHLMNRGFAELAVITASVLAAPGGAAERLHALFQRTYRLFLDHIAEVRLMYAMYYGPPQGAPHFDFDLHHDKLRTAVRRLLAAGVKTKAVQSGDLDHRTWVVLGCLAIAVETQLTHPERSPGARGLARMLDIALAGAARPRPRATRSSR